MLSKIKDKRSLTAIISITNNAWLKVYDIVKDETYKNMYFSATTGGCNGFNFNFSLLEDDIYDDIKDKNPTIITKEQHKVFIDPVSEMFLMGTTIDYIKEDYKKNIYENKFIFNVDKKLLASCGCGVSFSPKM